MFELAVAWKYLRPRRKQLSVSIISIVSVCVIALVVWLMLLFFSITSGVERHWISRLVAVTAPVRITPTPAYYASYYYQVDAISAASDYRNKSLAEKHLTGGADPYDPTFDSEIPDFWPAPDLASTGKLRDLVGETFTVIDQLKSKFLGLRAKEYETAFASLRLRLARPVVALENSFQNGSLKQQSTTQSAFLNQSLLIGSLDPQQAALRDSLLPITTQDVENVLQQLGASLELSQEDLPSEAYSPQQKVAQEALNHFFSFIEITAVRVPETGASQYGLLPGTVIPVTLLRSSLNTARSSKQLLFTPHLASRPDLPPLSLNGLQVEAFSALQPSVPFWVTSQDPQLQLLKSEAQGEAILLPKAFKDAGVLVGDRGYLAYNAPTLSTVQEQRLPIFVAAFYDPGMLPIGGKLGLMDAAIPSLLLSAYQAEEAPLSSGIHVHMNDFYQADQVKQAIIDALKAHHLQDYWKVETFREYEFTKELLQQLRSDRHLSLVIAAIILLIACSNIISMQLLLVHDKKKEIAILRAMGASSQSIMTIFGLSGLATGLLGSLIGTLAAFATLYHLDNVLYLISLMQGYELFNPTFYGTRLPSELSKEGVALIWGATALLSLIAGVIPAVKASCMTPSTLLRSE